MDRENCQKLYKRYLELKEKTALEAHTMNSKNVKMQILYQDAFKELDIVIEELKNSGCLNFLSKDELIGISEDEELGPKASEILSQMN